MKPVAALCFLLVAGPALAMASFDARVRRAKIIERSPDGEAYQQVLWQKLGSHAQTVMQQCLPKNVKADVDFFTLVGDVKSDHTMSRVEVRPQTRMSQCFADGFGHGEFPSPPDKFGERGMPIYIDMRITP